MTDELLLQQASCLESLLPRLMRRMFSLEPDHPANDLPVAQLRICSILQGGPRSMSAISEELGISVSAITQIADRLERSGIVERVSERDDRRVRHLQLTRRGEEIMRSRREWRVRRAAKVLEKLSPEMRETVLHVLQILLDANTATTPEIPADIALSVRLEQ